MVGFFEGLNEIQETYNAFENQYDLLYDHNQRRKEESKAYDNLVDWKRYMKERPEYVPILDKIKLRRIKISLESWETVCELVDSTIQDGQVAYKRRWFASENLLIFLELPLMDPIEDDMPLKLKLKQFERGFLKAKEQIQ